MPTYRRADAHWEGPLQEGKGQVTLASSGLGTFDVTWASRTEQPDGRTSPEELIAAAHSTCYAMSLSLALAKAGTPPTALDVSAEVGFQPGKGITGVALTVVGDVPGVDADTFATTAQSAKENCPVSKALAALEITLSASLKE